MQRSSPALVALACVVLVVMLDAACAAQPNAAKGSSCTRASDCADGLICAANVCTDDLSKLDSGTVPNFDSGTADSALPPPADTTVLEDGPPGEVTPPPSDTTPPDDTTAPPDTNVAVDSNVAADTTPPPDTGLAPDTTAPDGD